jgi:hypothetical protein
VTVLVVVVAAQAAGPSAPRTISVVPQGSELAD